MKKRRVIDVGCGGCELSRDLLRHLFEEIHFLDNNKHAVAEAYKLKNEFKLKAKVF